MNRPWAIDSPSVSSSYRVMSVDRYNFARVNNKTRRAERKEQLNEGGEVNLEED